MKYTPNLDARQKHLDSAYASYRCVCEKPPRAGTRARTEFLRRHAVLCKKKTVNGWRRSWQCKNCLRGVSGDGINAGPPTQLLPVYIPFGDPVRQEAFEKRFAPVAVAKETVPSRREAWFRDHDLYLQTPQWKNLRAAVLERDGGRCTACGAKGSDVHHLTYERWQEEKLEDLTTLCRSCHEKEHAHAT